VAYSAGAIKLLIDLGKRGILKGSVLDIGAGQVSTDVTEADIEAFNQHFGSKVVAKPGTFVSELFAGAGLDYKAIDIIPSDKHIVLDLNTAEMPADLKGTFDVVFNIGTTEHLCNQGNAFKAIHDALKVDGYCFCALPGLGLFNHGMVTYSLKFFIYLIRANDYELIHWNLPPPSYYQDLSSFGPTGVHYPCSNLMVEFRKKKDQPFRYPSDTDHALATLHTKWEGWRDLVRQAPRVDVTPR
jgi:SAM-dependent methyltransferase